MWECSPLLASEVVFVKMPLRLRKRKAKRNREYIHVYMYIQSTLPVCHGGLGIQSAVQLAPSAFLASAAASSGLAHLILPANMQPPQLSYVDEALASWSQGCQEQPPTDAAAHHQKTWDSLRVSSIADTLFTDSSDPMHRARFLAASCKESGAWLNALPVTSLGLLHWIPYSQMRQI